MNFKKLETKNSFLPIWLLVAWHEEDADCTLPDRGATAHLTTSQVADNMADIMLCIGLRQALFHVKVCDN